MKATDYGEKNPLRCPICDDYRYLRIKGVRFKQEDKTVGYKIPFFECVNCGISTPIEVFPTPTYDDKDSVVKSYRSRADFELDKMKPGESFAIITPFEKDKFPPYDKLGFIYDSQDYHYIPGLVRPWNEGFLCPVFFNKDLLLYYNNSTDYRVVFSSFSRVEILNKDNEPIIEHGFGINRNGNIFCWLGDLQEEFSKPENRFHKNQFITFNIESDHDVISDYYFGEIEANFSDSDNEVKVFKLRNDFDKKIFDSLGRNLTHINLDQLQTDYKHPIINEIDQINSSYIKLNSILIESFDVENLKNILVEFGVQSKDIKGLKGLKLFEKFLLFVLKVDNANEIVSPLFVLYDLRVLAGHIKNSEYQDKLSLCKSRLKIDSNSTEIQTFEKLISNLISMYEFILKIKI